MSLKSYIVDKLFSGVSEFLNVKHQHNEFKLKALSIGTPCSAEDNFLSEIYSLNVEVQLEIPASNKADKETYNFIAKSQIFDPNNPDDVRRYVFHLIFTKEKLTYQIILEKMEKLLLERGIPRDQAPLAPKLHHFISEGESYSCLLLDNLISLGYYIPSTHGTGITLAECNSLMKAMARFHATSLVMEGQDGIPLPQTYEISTAEFFLSPATAESMIPIVRGSYEGIIQLAEKFRPDLVPLLKNLDEKEDVWDRLCSLVKPGITSFTCLCHGDPRLNNVFISREDVRNVRFIDFQLTRYASPLTDLQYILYMGATKEFRQKHTEEVLNTYFDEFTSIVNGFQPEVKLIPSQEAAVMAWTKEKMREEYDSMTMYGFLIAMTLLPIILLRPGDIEKSVGQMSTEERERFWNFGRKEMVFQLGCKHADVRQRLFDICDEAFALIK